MKVNVAHYGGFCFGVKRAIGIALKTAAAEATVCMLGDIVHNEEVIKQIGSAGIKRIKRLGAGERKTLLLSAHGTGTAIIDNARHRGYNIVDATCPMVKGIHKIAKKMEVAGHTIIIIGDRDHDEVHGIMGQLKTRPIVIDQVHTIPRRRISKIRKAAVVVQSTQNADNVFKIIDVIKHHIPDVQFFNTICRPTRTRQAEMRTMPLKNDVMIIIGSRNSANTQRLCQIARSLNSRTYCIASREDIKPEWFAGARSVGVASGASTPDVIINEIVAYLRQLNK